MATQSGDNWAQGDAYEAYMGRWSRLVARAFLEWLAPEPLLSWLEVGCGTGALTSTILGLGDPVSVTGCDLAEPFVRHAQRHVTDARASFVVGSLDALPSREGGFDAVVSGLVLNFLPDPMLAVTAMRERLRPNGTVAAYVWDYATGLEFVRHFWDEAAALEPRALALDEGPRFPLCAEQALWSLFRAAGLTAVETKLLDVPTEFASFDDYWTPFLGGTGPAPSYVTALAPAQRDALRERLRQRIPAAPDGRIQLRARAWAVRGRSA